jgi:hypothetical protein
MPTNFAIEWDATGERWFQTGVCRGVLYPMDSTGTYPTGVAWNGLTGVEENPDGGDLTELWADNIKYASFRNPENYGGSIKAYTYPDEWMPCDGQKLVGGIAYQGQKRQPFGMCYRNEISNDIGAEEYELKLLYNSTVSPSSKSHATKNENPDAEEMSWDYKSTPVNVTGVDGVDKTCMLTLNSRQFTDGQMAAIEEVLYGKAAEGQTPAVAPRLPLPAEVASIIAAAT